MVWLMYHIVKIKKVFLHSVIFKVTYCIIILWFIQNGIKEAQGVDAEIKFNFWKPLGETHSWEDLGI